MVWRMFNSVRLDFIGANGPSQPRTAAAGLPERNPMVWVSAPRRDDGNPVFPMDKTGAFR